MYMTTCVCEPYPVQRQEATMGPRHNIYHAPPEKHQLKELRRQSTRAMPLVKKAVTPTGEVYYPVFLPFHARVICPWCFQVSYTVAYRFYTRLMTSTLFVCLFTGKCHINIPLSHQGY